MKKFGAILFAALILAGCGRTIAAMSGIQIVNPNDSITVDANTKKIYDRHTKTWNVEAPVIFAQNTLLGHTYLLRAWYREGSKKEDAPVQLYVTARLKNWYFLSRAYSFGKRLSFTKIAQDVGSCSSYGCNLRESVGINLSIKEIRELAEEASYDLKIEGNRGSIEISVPGKYFYGFLTALYKIK